MHGKISILIPGIALVLGSVAPGALAGSLEPADTATTTTQVTEIRLGYKVYMGGSKIAKMNIDMSLGDKEYWVRGSGRTVGLLDKVARTRFSGAAHGTIDNGSVRPKLHISTINQKKRDQRVRIAYDADRVPEIKAEPAFKKSSKRTDLLAKTLPHTIDPVSLFVAPIIQGKSALSPDQCNRRVLVLDGRRRFNVIYKHKASYGAYRLRKPAYTGPALLCTARIVPVGGYKRSGIWPKLARQKPANILLVPAAGNKYLVPLKIVTASPLGKIVVRASSYSVKSATRKLSLRDQ
ncbi:MAG: DUF3108 domain-containing protein [Halocynthiibacter sp.]